MCRQGKSFGDEINAVPLNPLVTGVRLHAVIDADQNHSELMQEICMCRQGKSLTMRSMRCW